MSNERAIRDNIRRIVGSSKDFFMTAQVKSVDGDTCVISCGDDEFEDVLLTPLVDDDKNKILIIPAIGSTVLVADLSEGERRLLQVITFSTFESITLNGGKLGGLVNINDLVSKLNAMVSKFNAHTHQVSTTGTATAQAGIASVTTNTVPVFKASDFEDDKIKH